MSKNITFIITMLLIILCICFSFKTLTATQLDLGNKPLALGSAYTAISGDVYSIYSNPAGLYGGYNFDLKLDLLGSVNFTGNILYNANQIIETKEKYEKIRQAQQQGSSIDITQIAAFFNGIKNLVEINQPGKGMLGQINGGLGVKIKNFAFSVRNVTNIGLKPSIDTGFSLSTSATISPVLNFVSNKLKFANGSNEGIVITTDTLNNPQLTDARDQLSQTLSEWLIPTLESLGVVISSDVKNNPTGIANALINLAETNNVPPDEIRNAVSQLSDPNLQSLINNFISNMYNQQDSFNNNNSGLVLKGINYTEIALGYSHQVINNLLVGGKLKYLFGKTLYYNFKVFQEQEEIDFNDLKDLENKLTKNISAIDLDIGAIYKLPISIVETNIGLVIKNLLEPKFDLAGTDEKLKLPRQLTFGVSGKLWKIFNLGLDYNLNKVETLVDGYNIQNLAIGLEINPPIFPSLRFGYLKNLAMDNDQLYTVGLGIKIWTLNIDLVGTFNPQETKINKDLTLFANNLSLGLTLGMKF